VLLPEKLAEKSSLTPRQLEVLRSHRLIALGEMKYRDAAAKGTSKSVTIGSYFRTLQQARQNVRKAIVTVLIGVWLGTVNADDVRRLLDVAGREIGELPNEENARLVEVLHVLIDKIVA
jgi:predicted DNA-binding protein (UPF0251 family)